MHQHIRSGENQPLGATGKRRQCFLDAFLAVAEIHTFTEGMTRGVGYLAIVAVIFGNWRIGRVVGACLMFGAATALQFQLPAFGIHLPNALLIMLPYVLALLAVAGLVGRQTAPRALAQPIWR